MNINDLPDEVLCLHLFPYLDLRSRASAELTCRRWRRLISHLPQRPISLWLRTRGSNYYEYLQPAFVYGQLPFAEWDSYSLSSEQAKLFLAKHNRGRSLFLFARFAEDLQVCLDVIQEKWQHLERLHIEFRDYYVDQPLIITRHGVAKHVVQLLLTNFHGRDPNISKLFRCCTGLEALCIEGHFFDQLETLDQTPPRFRGLFLTENSFGDVDRLLGGPSNQLEELGVKTCDDVELKRICDTMKNLVTLKFQFTGKGYGLGPLVSLKKLTNLSFWCSNPKMDVELVRVLSKCPNIKTLEVCLDFVSTTLVESLPTATPRLEALTLWEHGHSDKFSEAVQHLNSLVQLSNLKTLGVLVHETYITDLVDFIRNSSSIRNMDTLWSNTLDALLQIFDVMNAKAAENPSARFKLHSRIPSRYLNNVTENLTVYCM